MGELPYGASAYFQAPVPLENGDWKIPFQISTERLETDAVPIQNCIAAH